METAKHNATGRLEAYLTIEGTKQGKFKGDSQQSKHKDDIVVITFDYGAKAPRDVATGQASGKRQHGAFKFTSHLGPATPQLMNALVTNEVLKNVVLNVYRSSHDGAEEVGTTIKLTKATVASYELLSDGATQYPEVRCEMTFQKIEVENKSGKTMMADDWHA
jgi:type VI secretion system secreted protein Hcp